MIGSSLIRKKGKLAETTSVCHSLSFNVTRCITRRHLMYYLSVFLEMIRKDIGLRRKSKQQLKNNIFVTLIVNFKTGDVWNFFYTSISQIQTY